MRPVHDIDVLLLLATTLAAKRRPADLAEIMVAADLIRSGISFESKLEEAFLRLSTHGLIRETDGRYALTPEGQKIMTTQRRKTDLAERVFMIKEALAAHEVDSDHPAISLTAEQVDAALVAHQAAANNVGKSVLIPDARKAEFIEQHQNQWRRPPGAHKRRG